MPVPTTLTSAATMQQVLEAFPGARRALFRRYHIGGCSSCGFSPSETVDAVCARNGGLPVAEVLSHLEQSHGQDLQLLLEPAALAAALREKVPPVVLDVRNRDEWETARIPGSELFTQDLMQQILGGWDRARVFVIVDHAGRESLDAAAYFAGHGFTGARALRGGVDAWAAEVDPAVPRYRLE